MLVVNGLCQLFGVGGAMCMMARRRWSYDQLHWSVVSSNLSRRRYLNQNNLGAVHLLPNAPVEQADHHAAAEAAVLAAQAAESAVAADGGGGGGGSDDEEQRRHSAPKYRCILGLAANTRCALQLLAHFNQLASRRTQNAAHGFDTFGSDCWYVCSLLSSLPGTCS